MGSAEMNHQDLLRDVYNPVSFYGSKERSELPQYNGKDTHFTEYASGRSDGQVDSSGGEDSYADDSEKDGSSAEEEEGQYATLESVGSKYPIDSEYRNEAQDVNVIEFKDTVHATPYHFPSFPTYYQGDGGEASQYPTGMTSDYKQEKYEEEDTGGKSYTYPPYASYAPTSMPSKPRDMPYPYSIPPPPPMPAGAHQQLCWGGYGPPEQTQSMPTGKAGVFLCNRELWTKFNNFVTEMIVTRHGR